MNQADLTFLRGFVSKRDFSRFANLLKANAFELAKQDVEANAYSNTRCSEDQRVAFDTGYYHGISFLTKLEAQLSNVDNTDKPTKTTEK